MRSILNRTRRSRITDMLVFAGTILAILSFLRFLPEPEALSVSGPASVIDGDSIVVRKVEIRLQGIDAPERGQPCTRNGLKWQCGDEASRQLRNRLRGRTVSCTGRRRDVHDRLLATCIVDGTELNRWLVEQGWAVSYHDYQSAERNARSANRGIWSGSFVRPSMWREKNR